MGDNGLPDYNAELDGDDWAAADIDLKQSLMRQFNAKRSFTCMTVRRLQRQYQGVHKKKSFVVRFVMWLILAYTLAMLAAVILGYVDPDADSSSSDNVLYSVMFVCIVYIFMDVMMVVRWLIYWLLLAVMLTFDITGKIYSLFWLDEKLTKQQTAQRNAILIALVVMEFITVFVAIGLHYVYPTLVKRGYVNTMRWLDVRPGRWNNTLIYRPSSISKRHIIVYSGGLNAEGQPHGYGMWTDSASNGERLTGQWENGIPIGPFRSFEHGSGYCFVNLRIAYCHNRSEAKPDEISHLPKHSQDGLHWGVASVECSVSGGFYRFLPAVSHLTPFNEGGKAPQNAADVLPFLRTPADDVGLRHRLERTGSSFEKSSKPQVLGGRLDLTSNAASTIEKEALVFLHGYNCPLDYSLSRLAQLLALGDFPSHLHPFVFSWPSGGPLSYFQAKATGTDSEKTSNDFKLFLGSLADAGYKSVNIVAHSMGARIYFSALNRGYLDDIFTRSIANLSHESAKMRLSTLTFCNPDYSRDEFVRYGGAYDQSSQFCNHITLYPDSMDGALFYAEIFSKKKVWGPLEYSLGRRGYTMHRDNHRDRVEYEDLLLQESSVSHSIALDAAVVKMNQQRKFEGVKFFAYNDDPEQTNGASPYAAHGRDAKYLDMDVIDTTWMDNNVHAIRHNYFNLNPTLVEDLRQSIVGKKRASDRPSLLKTMAAENVYIFLVAPSHIKNK